MMIEVDSRVADANDPSTHLGAEKAVNRVKTRLQVGGIALLVFVCPFAYAWWRTGDWALVYSYLQGQRVFLSQAELFLGEVDKEEAFEVVIEVLNFGREARTIQGAKGDCACISLGELPVRILPAQKSQVIAKFSARRSEQFFEHQVVLFSDDPVQYRLVATIQGIAR